MPAYVCVSGIYRNALIYVCVGGIYKRVRRAFVCVNGIYKAINFGSWATGSWATCTGTCCASTNQSRTVQHILQNQQHHNLVQLLATIHQMIVLPH